MPRDAQEVRDQLANFGTTLTQPELRKQELAFLLSNLETLVHVLDILTKPQLRELKKFVISLKSTNNEFSKELKSNKLAPTGSSIKDMSSNLDSILKNTTCKKLLVEHARTYKPPVPDGEPKAKRTKPEPPAGEPKAKPTKTEPPAKGFVFGEPKAKRTKPEPPVGEPEAKQISATPVDESLQFLASCMLPVSILTGANVHKYLAVAEKVTPGKKYASDELGHVGLNLQHEFVQIAKCVNEHYNRKVVKKLFELVFTPDLLIQPRGSIGEDVPSSTGDRVAKSVKRDKDAKKRHFLRIALLVLVARQIEFPGTTTWDSEIQTLWNLFSSVPTVTIGQQEFRYGATPNKLDQPCVFEPVAAWMVAIPGVSMSFKIESPEDLPAPDEVHPVISKNARVQGLYDGFFGSPNPPKPLD